MERKFIKEGQLIIHDDKEVYGIAIITNVRKADRGDEKELMYDIKYLINNDVYEGICEHSGMTSCFLKIISKEDAFNKLLSREYDLDIEIAERNKDRINVIKAKSLLNAL